MRYSLFLLILLSSFYSIDSRAQSDLHVKNVHTIMNDGLYSSVHRGLTKSQRSNIEKAIRKQVEAQRREKEAARMESERNARRLQEWEQNNREAPQILERNLVYANDRVRNMSGAVRSGTYVKIPEKEPKSAISRDTLADEENNGYDRLCDVINNISGGEKSDEERTEKDERQLTFVPDADSPVVPTSPISCGKGTLSLSNPLNNYSEDDFPEYTDASSYTPDNIRVYENFKLKQETLRDADTIQILVLDSVVVSKLENSVFSINQNDSIETLLTADTEHLHLYYNNGSSFFIVMNDKTISRLLIYQPADKTYQELVRMPHAIDNVGVLDNRVLLLVKKEVYELDDDLQLTHITFKP